MLYDRAGKVITLEEWVALVDRVVEDLRAGVPDAERYKVVGRTEVADSLVSTVWLGTDYNAADDGPPIIFETMIFGGPLDQMTWRYATEAQAKAGHVAAVAEAESAALRHAD